MKDTKELRILPEPAVLRWFRPAVLLAGSSAGLPPGASQDPSVEASNNSREHFPIFLVLRNVTVPNVSWKEECRTVNQTLPPRQKTIYVEQNVTKSQRICNKVYKEETFNYTMPKYEVIKTNRSEKVGQGGVSFKRLRSAKDEVGLKEHHFRFHLWCRSASFGRRRKSTITHSPMQVRTVMSFMLDPNDQTN